MVHDGNELRPLRGKGIPVLVRKNCGRDELLKTAVEKHQAHSKHIIRKNTSFTHWAIFGVMIRDGPLKK